MNRSVSLKPKDLIIFLIVVIITVVAVAVILSDLSNAASNGYSLLFIMPLSYLAAFLTVVASGKYYAVKNSIVGLIVFGIYFARDVLTPLTMPLANYTSVMNTGLARDNNSIAIIMVAIETMIVGVYLPQCISKRLNNKNDAGEETIRDNNNKPSQLIWLFVLALVVMILLILRMDASILRSEFLFLLDTNKQYYALSETASGIGTLSMWAEIMEAFFRIVQVLLPPLLIWNIYRFRIPDTIKYILSFIILVAVSVVGTENRIDAIFAGVAVLLSMRKLYGQQFKSHFKLWIVLILFATAFGLSIKSGLVSRDGSRTIDYSGISVMLSAYFSGVHTVAAGISMISAQRSTLNLLKLIPDALSKIPFFSYALQLVTGITLRNSNQMFNDYIGGILGRIYGQILPTTALGYEYFSLLYFIYPCLLIRLAVYFENKIEKQKDIVHLNLYYWITICVAGSPVIASGLLVVAKLSWFAVIYVILFLFDRKKTRSIHN